MNTSSLMNRPIVFATASYDRNIRLWEWTGASSKVFQHNDSQVNCMAIHPNKTLLATGGYQQVCIYDLNANNNNSLLNLEGTVKNTVAIGFNEKATWMYTAGEDRTIKIWDMSKGLKHINCAKTLIHTQPISCVALHPNQVDILFGDEAGNLMRWDIRKDTAQSLFFESKSPIRSISINAEGDYLAAVNNDATCFFWYLMGGFGEGSPPQLGRLIRKDQIHKRYALKCLFSPDSVMLATSSADGSVKIWKTVDITSGSYSAHKEYRDARVVGMCWVWDLAFTSDGKHMLTVASDKNARLWDVNTGEIVQTFSGHTKPISCLAFSDTK